MPQKDNFNYEEGFKSLKDTLESADKLSSHFINMLDKSKPACNKIIEIIKAQFEELYKQHKDSEKSGKLDKLMRILTYLGGIASAVVAGIVINYFTK